MQGQKELPSVTESAGARASPSGKKANVSEDTEDS